MAERVHIFCKSARHDVQQLGRQEIETFIRARGRWVPSPPVRARQRAGDWSQGRHPSTERIVDAAQHVYRVEYQRVPERYSTMQRWPRRVTMEPEGRLLPVYIEIRTGREVEYSDIPLIDHRWFDLKCRCGVASSPREALLNQLLDRLAEADQQTVSLELVAQLTSNGY